MTVSTAALSFLVLAAALGSQAQVTDDTETKTLLVVEHPFQSPTYNRVFHHAADCCFSYKQNIQCARMKDYFETSSGCSQPGVIFLTWMGRSVCANPRDSRVQSCMKKLKHSLTPTNPGTM